MDKYISREELDDFFDREIRLYEPCPDKYDAAVELKSSSHVIPAADVQPVVKAKWKDDWETGCSECSACGESYLWEDYDGVGEWNYCPNCGSKICR